MTRSSDASTIVGPYMDGRRRIVPVKGAGAPSPVITVCHPVWRLGRGGLERQLVHIVNRLGTERFRHVVVTVDGSGAGDSIARELSERVTLIRHSLSRRPGAWSRQLADVLGAHSVDVIHVRGLSLLVDTLLSAQLHGDVRVACSFHGFQQVSGEFQGIRRKVLREALLQCDERWAVGFTAARSIVAELNLPADAFDVICNGVDAERFAPASQADRLAARALLGLPADRMVALCLGNMKPIKGQQVLFDALRRIDKACPGVFAVFVGEDGLGGELQAEANVLSPGIEARFAGETTDPLPWYQAADLFVLPSLSEGLSNALLEAMACGLPVIATAVGGNLDVIEHGCNGLLVPANDPSALAAAMERMIEDDRLRRECGVSGRRRVEREFNVIAMASAYAERYERLGRREEEGAAPIRPALPRTTVSERPPLAVVK